MLLFWSTNILITLSIKQTNKTNLSGSPSRAWDRRRRGGGCSGYRYVLLSKLLELMARLQEEISKLRDIWESRRKPELTGLLSGSPLLLPCLGKKLNQLLTWRIKDVITHKMRGNEPSSLLGVGGVFSLFPQFLWADRRNGLETKECLDTN